MHSALSPIEDGCILASLARTAGKERRSFQRLIRKHNIDIKKLRANSA